MTTRPRRPPPRSRYARKFPISLSFRKLLPVIFQEFVPRVLRYSLPAKYAITLVASLLFFVIIFPSKPPLHNTRCHTRRFSSEMLHGNAFSLSHASSPLMFVGLPVSRTYALTKHSCATGFPSKLPPRISFLFSSPDSSLSSNASANTSILSSTDFQISSTFFVTSAASPCPANGTYPPSRSQTSALLSPRCSCR